MATTVGAIALTPKHLLLAFENKSLNILIIKTGQTLVRLQKDIFYFRIMGIRFLSEILKSKNCN